MCAQFKFNIYENELLQTQTNKYIYQKKFLVDGGTRNKIKQIVSL